MTITQVSTCIYYLDDYNKGLHDVRIGIRYSRIMSITGENSSKYYDEIVKFLTEKELIK